MTMLTENRSTRESIKTTSESFYFEIPVEWIQVTGRLAVDPEWQFQREKAAFERQLPTLKRTHPGQYVAIHNGRPEAFGSTESEVVQKFFGTFGDTHVYIGYVGDTQPEAYQVSPITAE